MLIAALLALALDESNLPSPPLVLELKARESVHAAEDPVLELALVNRSGKPVKIVKPGDGSEVGWREPYVFWTAETRGADGTWTALSPRGYGRCGHYAAFWEKDVVELKPGERFVIQGHLRQAQRTFDFNGKGRVRLVAHYQYRGSRERGVEGRGPLEDGPMKGIKPFHVKSAAVEFEVK